jgi:hypothetical protein
MWCIPAKAYCSLTLALSFLLSSSSLATSLTLAGVETVMKGGGFSEELERDLLTGVELPDD